MFAQQIRIFKTTLAIALLLNIATWIYARPIQARWTNVPPVPTEFRATIGTLGDSQMAYRATAIFLINLGSSGGRVVPLKDYDFNRLADWFFLGDKLDSRSDSLPYLAAMYYGASQDPQKIRPLLEYLKVVGNNPEGEKWRWLAHGAYLARFKLKDPELALEMANILSVIPNEDMPFWARQMPANILNDQGEKEAAMQLILEILRSSADQLHPNEVNAMLAYLCERVFDPGEAKQFELCETYQ